MIGLIPTYRLPAEWEPQRGVLLTWPHEATDWLYCLDEITETFIQLADAITKVAQLTIATPEPEVVAAMLDSRLTPGQKAHIAYCHCPTNDTWARDHGPISLVAGTTQEEAQKYDPLRLDFQFNGWGEKFPADLDNAITSHMMQQRLISGVTESHLDFVLEGGSIETDGRGTVFTTTACLMAPHRNQPLTKEQIDKRLRQMLSADRIVWLDHGQLIGDDTDGHIDTIVRPCAYDTLLYIRCDNPNDEHYEEFKALEEQLKGLRTAEDKPYKLMPLPFPDPIYYDGERLPATYANFLIINGAVLVPTYGQPENDAKALETLQKAFPDREMVPIDSTIITRQHGSIHCCTMQIPKEMQF